MAEPDREKRNTILDEQTEYIVSENKIKKLEEYLQAKKNSGQEKLTLVLVEDSLSNLKKVKQIMDMVFGNRGEYIPIGHHIVGQEHK